MILQFSFLLANSFYCTEGTFGTLHTASNSSSHQPPEPSENITPAEHQHFISFRNNPKELLTEHQQHTALYIMICTHTHTHSLLIYILIDIPPDVLSDVLHTKEQQPLWPKWPGALTCRTMEIFQRMTGDHTCSSFPSFWLCCSLVTVITISHVLHNTLIHLDGTQEKYTRKLLIDNTTSGQLPPT